MKVELNGDLSGKQFKLVTVIKQVKKKYGKERFWKCQCVCGRVIVISTSALTKNTSCGCAQRRVGNTHKKHGLTQTPEYKAWTGMWQRCTNPKQSGYKSYGGKGIKVCEQWSNFMTFYKDIGPKPSTLHSLDRINVYGGYEPNNCRWATSMEQAHNKRNLTDDYQDWTVRTAIYPKDEGIIYTTMGLAGEAGEVSNQVKKMIRDDNSILTLERKEKLIDELGDVCWYVARLATELDMPFSKILARNREKLNDRLARGKIQGSGDNR